VTNSISFYARGDGSSANNAALNVDNTSQQPTVELTFEASTGGDIVLEQNGGNPDPDTTVLINGIRYEFTVELIGELPASSNKVPDPLEGKQITVISAVVDGTYERFFFVNDGSGTLSLMDQFGNGAVSLNNADFSPPPVHVCFCAGTGILTPSGFRAIEDLLPGDLVVTAQNESKPILWLGRTEFSMADMQNDPATRPVRIKANAVSSGVPFADTYVSAQHRVALTGPMAELLFGDHCVMVRAKHLVGSIAETVMPESPVSYFHMLLDAHDMVVANGLEAESFQPSIRNYLGLPNAMKTSLNAVVKRDDMHRLFRRSDSMGTLKRHEADALLGCMFAQGVRTGSVESQANNMWKAVA